MLQVHISLPINDATMSMAAEYAITLAKAGSFVERMIKSNHICSRWEQNCTIQTHEQICN